MDESNTENNEILVGLSQEKISPPFTTQLFHFDEQERKSSRILDDIYVKVLHLQRGDSGIFIISLDLIWLSNDWTAMLKKLLGKEYGLQAENFLFCATHSHSTPSIRPNTFNEAGSDQNYVSFLTDRVQRAVKKSVNSLQKGSLTISSGFSEQSVYRRKRIPDPGALKKWTFKTMIANRPDPHVPIDNSFALVRIYSQSGRPLGALLNLASHPSIYRGNGLSGDFPGHLSNIMKERYGDHFVTVFLQGFSGNIRPGLTFRPKFQWRRPLLSLFRKVFDRELFVKTGGEKELADFAAALAKDIFYSDSEEPLQVKLSARKKRIALPLSKLPGKDFFIQFQHHEKKLMRDYGQFILENYSSFDSVPFSVQRISLAENVAIVALEGEIFTEYALWLHSKYSQGDRYVFPVSCANGMVGYIPDASSLEQGGYEVERSLVIFGLPAKFSIKIENILKQAISEVMPW